MILKKTNRDAMKKTDNIQSLADQVEKLESLQKDLRSRTKYEKFKIRNTKSFW